MIAVNEPSRDFCSTPWTLIFTAAEPSKPDAQEALSQLCNIYWYPVYTFLRRQQCSAEEAEDLTQEFFKIIIEKNLLRFPTPARGRFRSFIRTAVKHLLLNDKEKQRAIKRGGGYHFESWESLDAESRYVSEPQNFDSPEVAFDRTWAQSVIKGVENKLRSEVEGRDGIGTRFDVLQPFLMSSVDQNAVALIATRLSITEGAVKALLHRMREIYRQLFVEEVRATVENDDELGEEMRHLASMLYN